MSDFPELQPLGWCDFFQKQLQERSDNLLPWRVTGHHGERWTLAGAAGARWATVSGRLRHRGERWPAVGDWVLTAASAPGDIVSVVHVLERKTALKRSAVGPRVDEQVIAANVDTALVVTSFGADFSVARLERYLAVIRAGGAEPVIVLSKADVATQLQTTIGEASVAAGAASVVVTSVATGLGLDALRELDGPGRTLVLVGSSGVGKTSLVNALRGDDALPVAPIRERDGTGRHTTTARQMLKLAGGGLVIDTPGLREVGVGSADEGAVAGVFHDIQELARRCHFRDCGHTTESGCAVLAAIERGELDPRRLAGHEKLQREVAYHERRQSDRAKLDEKRRWRAITREQRRFRNVRGR